MSIKPQFVEKIRRGEKKFEFRRILPKREDIGRIVVYASKPVGKVAAEIFAAIVQDIRDEEKDIRK